LSDFCGSSAGGFVFDDPEAFGEGLDEGDAIAKADPG
jgi:hypothetical protein